jgi:hypothetical protein
LAVWDSGEDDLTFARWRSICERFHDIRLGAYRHGLADTWRQLATADPAAEGLLARWERLDEQILALDEDNELRFARRGGHAAHDDDDEWDAAADYVCPTGRCDRREIANLGLAPRCELSHCEMAPHPAKPASS